MKLVCMLVGASLHAFAVDVDPHAMIDELKEAINDRLPKRLALDAAMEFDLFAARRGDQWLSATSDEVADVETGGHSSVRDLLQRPLELDPTRIVDQIFMDLPPNTIHVLVRKPDPTTLVCLRFSAYGKNTFEVNIDLFATIYDLKVAIQIQGPGLRSQEPSALDLFQAIGPDGDWLTLESEAVKTGDLFGLHALLHDPLDPAFIVDDIFPRVPSSNAEGNVHVLVLDPRTREELRVLLYHLNRRKRWRDLNEALETLKESERWGYVSEDEEESMAVRSAWTVIGRRLYCCVHAYTPPSKDVPDQYILELHEYLTHTVAPVLNVDDTANARFFLVPMLLMLCRAAGDAKLLVDHEVTGMAVHATVKFPYVIARGNTRLCIMETYPDKDGERTYTRLRVGCEVVADVERLPVVYGVATDSRGWYFVRSGEETIQDNSWSLPLLDVEVLCMMSNMLYGMLCNDDGSEILTGLGAFVAL